MDARPPKKYEDVEEIKDVDGVVVVITRHRGSGKLGAGFFKTFDRDGDGAYEKTAFLSERHLDAVTRLVPIVRKRMAELREDTAPPEASNARARR